MKTLSVDVRQDHIDDGIPGHADRCPVALAICTAMMRSDVKVTSTGIWVAGLGFQTPAPDAVTRFVRAFDRDQSVNPFSFTIPDPREPAHA